MSFNADAFLNQTANGPMATASVPCPEGEYRAIIDDGEKAITFASGSKDGRNWHRMNVSFKILDDTVKQVMGKDSVYVPMQMFMDLNDEESGFATGAGKNISLGRLRDALGQNDDPNWTPASLKGKGPVMVKVTQRSDRNDPNIKYAEVSRVAKIS